MLKRPIPCIEDRSVGGCHIWTLENEFFRRLSRLSSDFLAPEDQEKTFFITLKGNYHYAVMPFGLKNARATYQQMVTPMCLRTR